MKKIRLLTLIKEIKALLKKNPLMSDTGIANTLTSYMGKSAMIVEKLGSNDDATIKRGLKRAFGNECKIKQSKGKKTPKHGS